MKWKSSKSSGKSLEDFNVHIKEASIIHRDIRPDDVLVTHDEYLKLADFGLAKDTNKGISMTKGIGTVRLTTT